jgi:hypothetical protein
MVFAIVQLVCKAVPRQHVTWIIAVPQQHTTFEHFEQTGAALQPACATIDAIVRDCTVSKGCGTGYEYFLMLERLEEFCSREWY